MIKKIDILGMQIDNYTVRESILRLDTYMSNTVLNIIETVTMKQLVEAAENPAIKDCLMQADLCIIGECEILAETGNATVQRMREVRDQDFILELLKRVVRNQKRVFLIAMTSEELEEIQTVFTEINPKFSIVGSYAVTDCVGDMDSIVNELNGTTPDIVISALNSPTEEEFILEHKDKIGAGVWYGIGSSYKTVHGHRGVGELLQKLAFRGKLRHSVSKYENENKDRK